MLLCVNVSNSKITLGVFDRDDIILKTSVSATVGKTTTEYAVLFKSVFDLHNFDTEKINGVIISCVVPALTAAVRDALGYIYKGKIFIVGPKLKNGLKIKSENPSQIGASLICQSVALTEKYPMPCLLISMGTALSMFALDKNGTFIGGAILPGIKMSAKALADHTAQLPQIDLTQKPHSVIGTNTVQNVQSGLIIGTACTIDGMIEKFKKELGENLTCVATGDIDSVVLGYCNNEILYDENLVLDGLKKIYIKNTK
ncbi:MAG: type III pantothenate kinase [Oscillospiraceae bacterium]|nr:type III pantothenate kinase [Oscillospiraceae bacterium]